MEDAELFLCRGPSGMANSSRDRESLLPYTDSISFFTLPGVSRVLVLDSLASSSEESSSEDSSFDPLLLLLPRLLLLDFLLSILDREGDGDLLKAFLILVLSESF